MATFRQIEIFLTLADELHFGRTAERLKITQAALSKNILALEKSVGCRLFDRTDKWNIRLTCAGNAYLKAIKNLPDQLSAANERAKQAERGESGMLTIAVANIVYSYLQLGELFRKMHEKYPAIKLNIRDCQGSPMVMEQLRTGKADVGFFAVNDSDLPLSGIRQKRLIELPLCLAIPTSHYLARKEKISVEDLGSCNFILPPRHSAPWLRKYFDDFYMTHFKCLPPVEVEALGILATRQLVTAGLGIGIVSKPPEADEQDNIIYRTTPLDAKRIILVGWDENNHSASLKNLLTLIHPVNRKRSAEGHRKG